MDLKTTILLFALVCALSAFFVMWAKWEEEKLKTKEERDNYQAALNLHNTTAERAQLLEAENANLNSYISDEINDYNKAVFEKGQAEQKCEGLELGIEYLTERNDELQDRLSALLCPMNDHVWKDGVCIKCGRGEKK